MEEWWDISCQVTLPPLEQAVPLQKGQPMTVEELLAVKGELQQLDVELKEFKEELEINVELIKEDEKRLDSLNRISSTVSESLDLETILNNAIDNLVDVMQADVAWIFLLDEKSNELTLASHRGSAEELLRNWVAQL